MKKVLQTINHSIGIDKQNFDLKIVNTFLSISIYLKRHEKNASENVVC